MKYLDNILNGIKDVYYWFADLWDKVLSLFKGFDFGISSIGNYLDFNLFSKVNILLSIIVSLIFLYGFVTGKFKIQQYPKEKKTKSKYRYKNKSYY